MFDKITYRIAGLFLVVALVIGCQGVEAPEENPGEDENIIAPEGKEDNFFSNVAQEYQASATVNLVLDPSYADKTPEQRLARATALMEGKTKQITWFLHVYLIDKSSKDGEAAEYGGLRAMVMDGSDANEALKLDPEDPLKFSFGFAIQVGGTLELLNKVRRDKDLAHDQNVFPLEMAKLANGKVIRFSHSGYSAGKWSPGTCDCEIETLDVKLERIESSKDAYLDYENMLADGVMDVSLHVGWDYHARYDITHSRTLYNWLVDDMGFHSPVETYQLYNRISGPLTRTTIINGREILMKITLFRPDPCESWEEDGPWGDWSKAVDEDENNKKRACPDWIWANDEANANPTTNRGAGNLMKDLKDSLKTRDAILFSGHSGYTYAYALASWYKTSAGDLDPPEIKAMDLPRDKSQLFVLSGCDTYHAAQAFKENPNKLGLHNADVVTTTSFSNAGDVTDTQDVIRALVGDSAGTFTAHSYGKMMKSLNPRTTDYGWGNFAMYGVHGLDDNPLYNPLGNPELSCSPCQKDSDCDALGNVCVRLNSNEKVCATECLHDNGCNTDQACKQFGSASSGYLKGMACVPRTLRCSANPPPPPPVEKEFTAQGELTKDQVMTYTIEVGPEARNIEVQMTGTNDADLYTRFNEAPSVADYNCRPYKSSANETCDHLKSGGATLEIMVRGYSSASTFELLVTWE